MWVPFRLFSRLLVAVSPRSTQCEHPVIDHPYVHRGMAWVNRLRLRAVVLVIGIPLAAWGAISIGPAWLALPLVGVAVAAVTMTVNRLTNRLNADVCWTCGTSLHGLPPHEHGIACPACGALNQHNPKNVALASANDPDALPDDLSDERGQHV